jgi:hypothetical protein
MNKTIEYKGEKLPIRLSFKAMKMFKDVSKKNILNITEDLEPADIEHLFFCSYVSGCQKTNIAQKYKREDMEEILDDVYFEFVNLIPEFFEVDKKK